MPSPRELALYALLVTMELTSGFTVVVGSSLLDGVSIQYGLFWLLLLAGGVGLAVTLFLMRVGPGDPWNRLILLGGAVPGAIVPALLLSRTSVSFVLSAFLLLIAYWRGIAVTQEPPTHRDILSRFGFGLALLFLGLVWVVARGIDRQSSIWHMMAFLGIGYTVVTLVALGTARVEHAREPGAGAAVLLAIVAQLGVVILVGLAALQIFSLDLAGDLYAPTRPLWDALGVGLYHVVLLVASPIEWFLNLLRPQNHTRHPITIQPLVPGQTQTKKPKTPKPLNSAWVTIVAFGFAVLILLGVLYLIWRTLPRIPRRQSGSGFTEKRETLTLAEMWQLLLKWLRRLAGRGLEATSEAVITGRRRLFGDLPDDPVRRAYAQMLRRAASVGMQRPIGATADEFRDRLSVRWPEGASDFAGLTTAYARRRYGEMSPTPFQIDEARGHWGRLRVVMRIPTRERVEAIAPRPVLAAAGIRILAHPTRWRLSMPSLRDIFRVPEPVGDTEMPDWRSKVLVPIVSFVFPIVFIIALLALFAIIGSHGGGGGKHSLPAIGVYLTSLL